MLHSAFCGKVASRIPPDGQVHGAMSLFTSSRMGPRSRAALVSLSLACVALGLRVAASRGALWLDEIWSLNWATRISSPVQILTTVQHDNNHFLNTLYLFLLGSGWPWFTYRLLSVAAGVATVLVAGWIGLRRGRLEQVVAMVLTASSYLLVHYSSEARGYALIVFFSFASYQCLHRFLETQHRVWGGLFTLCSILGFLSHVAFAQVFIALMFWSVAGYFSDSELPVLRARSLGWCLGIPICVFGLLYLLNLRHMTLGGGPEYSMPAILLEAMSLTVGGPQGGVAAVIATLLWLAGVAFGFREIRSGSCGEWRFFAVVLLVPVLQVLVAQPPFLFVRYFLLASAFSLLLLSFALAAWIRRRGLRGGLAVTAITLFVLANSVHCVQLLRLGRGQYREALQYMASTVSSDPVRFASDHPHGNEILIDYYSQYIMPRRTFIHERAVDWVHQPPHWLILHRYVTWHEEPAPREYRVDNVTYQLRREFDCAMLSGWRWRCYQLQPN